MRLRQKNLPITLSGVLMLIGSMIMPSFTLAQGNTWAKKANMPTPRSLLSTSALNGKIYAIGGAVVGGSSAVEQYDPATDTWIKKAAMPTARQWLSTSAVNGKIYAIGGDARAFAPGLATVEEYDPATDTWTSKADMPTARFGLSTSVVDSKIYAIGGWIRPGNELTAVVEAYDPAANTWTEKAEMPTARFAHSTSVVDGKIYAIGGALAAGGAGIATVEMYDPAADTWTRKASMPTRRTTFLATSAVNGIIYVVGGISGEPGLKSVEAYNTATNMWSKKSDMPTARGFLGTSVVNGRIYAIGGQTGAHGRAISTVEEYTPPGVTSVEDPFGEQNLPTEFILHQNYPNPFNPATAIRYQLSAVSEVELVIYNHLGQKIRTLVHARQSAGIYTVKWDGRDDSGRRVASGVYLYRLQGGGLVQTRKMVLVQ